MGFCCGRVKLKVIMVEGLRLTGQSLIRLAGLLLTQPGTAVVSLC